MSKMADALEALPTGHKLTRADVARLKRAAVELRILREAVDAEQAARMDNYREGLEAKIRLKFLRESVEAALVETRTW